MNDPLKIKFDGVLRNATIEFWFRCPNCGATGTIDAEQAAGRVSIQCPSEGCSFHDTGLVDPLIESKHPLSRHQQFSLRKPRAEQP